MTVHIKTGLDEAAPLGTDAANTTDDYLRDIQDAIRSDINGFPGQALVYGADASSTNTYAFAADKTIDAYYTGMLIVLNLAGGNANTSTTPSLNIDSKGAKTIKRPDGSAVAAGDVTAGLNLLIYDGTNMLLLGSYSPSILFETTAQFASELNNGSKSANFDITLASAQKQKVTITAGTYTANLKNPPYVGNWILKLVNGGTASLSWSSDSGSVYWAGGAPPSWSSAGTDIVSIYYDGTNFYCVGMVGFA